MFEQFFGNKNHARIRALLVGDRLDLRILKTTEQLAAQPLTVPVAEQGCAVLYRYGAVALFDVPPLAEAAFLKQLQPFVIEPVAEIELDLLQARRSLRVEWYIVILIVMELLLSLYDKFLK